MALPELVTRLKRRIPPSPVEDDRTLGILILPEVLVGMMLLCNSQGNPLALLVGACLLADAASLLRVSSTVLRIAATKAK